MRTALLVLICFGYALPVAADEQAAESTVVVPSLQGFTLAQAQTTLRRQGLEVGTVYGMSRERIHAYLLKHYPTFRDPAPYARKLVYQRVFVHHPRSKARAKAGAEVDLVLVSRSDGPLPPGTHYRDLDVRPLPALTVPAPEDVREPVAEAPPEEVPEPATPEPDPPEEDPQPVRGEAEDANPVTPATTSPAPDPTRVADGGTSAEGSPDAPRVAPPADRNRVPPLLGLLLSDAEQLARDAELTLYVQRVAGQPAGRVLEQFPKEGAARPAGGVVKIVITAGGDFEGAVPDAPRVLVEHVDMPDLLDLTRPQAERILGDLGLAVVVLEARRGLASRVVDQKPATGERVHKGHAVRVWIGPGALPPAPTGPSNRGSDPRVDRATGVGAAPVPIAPTADTALPADALLTIGFSWRGVADADAYIVEIEEAAEGGDWVAAVRRRVKRTAATIDLERLDDKTPRRFRWRVRAIIQTKEAAPSDWVVLR